jgi:hypothetical protein
MKKMKNVPKIRWNHLWRRVRFLVQKYVLHKQIEREPFHIANILDPITLFQRLIELGFQPNYFAFCDQDEIFNLRRLRYNGLELWQEHVRVFPDELCGHFEIAYEEDAIRHFNGSTLSRLSDSTVDELLTVITPASRS